MHLALRSKQLRNTKKMAPQPSGRTLVRAWPLSYKVRLTSWEASPGRGLSLLEMLSSSCLLVLSTMYPIQSILQVDHYYQVYVIEAYKIQKGCHLQHFGGKYKTEWSEVFLTQSHC